MCFQNVTHIIQNWHRKSIYTCVNKWGLKWDVFSVKERLVRSTQLTFCTHLIHCDFKWNLNVSQAAAATTSNWEVFVCGTVDFIVLEKFRNLIEWNDYGACYHCRGNFESLEYNSFILHKDMNWFTIFKKRFFVQLSYVCCAPFSISQIHIICMHTLYSYRLHSTTKRYRNEMEWMKWNETKWNKMYRMEKSKKQIYKYTPLKRIWQQITS